MNTSSSISKKTSPLKTKASRHRRSPSPRKHRARSSSYEKSRYKRSLKRKRSRSSDSRRGKSRLEKSSRRRRSPLSSSSTSRSSESSKRKPKSRTQHHRKNSTRRRSPSSSSSSEQRSKKSRTRKSYRSRKPRIRRSRSRSPIQSLPTFSQIKVPYFSDSKREHERIKRIKKLRQNSMPKWPMQPSIQQPQTSNLNCSWISLQKPAQLYKTDLKIKPNQKENENP